MKKVRKFLINLMCLPPIIMVVLISLLPFWVLYLLSDLLYLLMWHVYPYRKKETIDNLKKLSRKTVKKKP